MRASITKQKWNAAFAPDAVSRIVAGFRQRLGAQVEVQVDLVDNIPAEKSGKFRYIISHA